MDKKTRTPGITAALGLALVLAASGCSSEKGSAQAASQARAADRDVTYIMPGRPGEPATTVGPDELAQEQTWNHADVAFMQMMIPHHGQALEISRLARTRADDPRVASLARRILAAQGPEILTMAAWLQERSIDVPRADEDPAEYDHGAHGHGSMQGMLTDEQMRRLGSARGSRFDRLFLEGMIAHHEGAVAMAQDVRRDGADLRVSETAAEVVAGQSAEIERMRELLRQL